MAESKLAVGIVVASRDEFDVVRPALTTLQRFECPCEVLVASVWAAPERLLAWAEHAEQRGCKLILASAGTEPQLPGFLAAASQLPVIAIPLAAFTIDPAQTLQAALRTSPAAPVAAVEANNPEQAALLALRILATSEPALCRPLEEYRQSQSDELEAQTRELAQAQPAPEKPEPVRPAAEPLHGAKPAQPVFYAESEEGPVEIRPAFLDRPLSGQPVKTAAEEPPLPTIPLAPALPARKLGRRRIDPDAPEIDLIEEAVDCLLEGGVLAFPTDTVYGLAADATNPLAVERLFELKGRPHNKAIVLLVDSPKMLSGIACNLTVESRRLMEAFWPGPLTIIFQKRGANFSYVSERETIGVRMPDHSVPLSLMQALARPLACTSANLAGMPPALSADEVAEALGDGVDLLLDSGKLPASPPSTVIDVTTDPYKILRLGAVSRVQLAAIVGDKLEAEV